MVRERLTGLIQELGLGSGGCWSQDMIINALYEARDELVEALTPVHIPIIWRRSRPQEPVRGIWISKQAFYVDEDSICSVDVTESNDTLQPVDVILHPGDSEMEIVS